MTSPAEPRDPRLPLFAPTVFEWAALFVGGALALRYAWMMDDAFVFFRYADNAAFLGNGLVYNAGEAVEGYSSPAWMLLLLGLRAPGWDFWIIIRVLGCVIWVATWWSLCALARKSTQDTRGERVINLPLAYLVLNYGFLCYFTSGIETPLVQLAAVLFALHTLSPENKGLQAVLAFSPLVRPELLLPLAIDWCFVWWRTRRVPLFMATMAILFGGSWLAFRIYMYADLVPNTFHLKDQNDFAQGWLYLWDTAGTYQLVPFLVFAAVLAFLGKRRNAGAGEPEEEHVDLRGMRFWMLALALPVAFYAVRIGGDARHYRYLAFPFILLVCATSGLAERAWVARGSARLLPWAIATLVFLCIPPQLSGHPVFGQTEHAQVNGINDAMFHRYHEDLAISAFGGGDPEDPLPKYAAFREAGRGYRGVFTNGRCVKIWRGFDLRWIHWHGLTDSVLAHIDMAPTRPGHKPGLRPLAAALPEIYVFEGKPSRGMFRRAVERGSAAPWIEDNLEVLERLEQRLFGERGFMESLRLALRPVGRIVIE